MYFKLAFGAFHGQVLVPTEPGLKLKCVVSLQSDLMETETLTPLHFLRPVTLNS